MTDWQPRLLGRLRRRPAEDEQPTGPAVTDAGGPGLREAVVDLVMASEQHPNRHPADHKRLGQAWDRHLTRFARAHLQAGMDDLGPRVRACAGDEQKIGAEIEHYLQG